MTGALILLIAHAAITWFMMGLIWFIQQVHYPLLSLVDKAQYTAYHRAHVHRVTWLVVVFMLLELLSALLLITIRPPCLSIMLPLAGLALIVAIWACTFFLLAPQHHRLMAGRHERALRLLVAYNWPRTMLWSVRGVLVGFMLYRVLMGESFL